MDNTIKVKAMRRALQTAKRDYDAGIDTATVIAYLSVIVQAQAPPRPVYVQLPMFAVVGRLTGKYHCQVCKHTFGENDVSPLQSKRAYLTLHCPHCGACWYTDNSQ